MVHSSASDRPTGRPSGPEVPAAQLLERYEDIAITKRRKYPRLPTRDELARAVGKRTATSVRSWCQPEVYNLPWPLFRLDEPVCLVDALSTTRSQLLYVNAALCELVGWPAGELLYQPSSVLMAHDEATDPEVLARRQLARALKLGEAEPQWLPAWLRSQTGDCLRVEQEMRYGPLSDAYFVRIRLLGVQLPLGGNVETDVWLDREGHRQQGLPPILRLN